MNQSFPSQIPQKRTIPFPNSSIKQEEEKIPYPQSQSTKSIMSFDDVRSKSEFLNESSNSPKQKSVQRKKRCAWTEEEDSYLTELVQKKKLRWKQIALKLNEKFQGKELNRTPKQCRERWTNCLDPEVKKKEWKDDEELILLISHYYHKNKWSEIAKSLKGRNNYTIKNHFYSLNTKILKLVQKNAFSHSQKSRTLRFIQTLYVVQLFNDELKREEQTREQAREQQSNTQQIYHSLTLRNLHNYSITNETLKDYIDRLIKDYVAFQNQHNINIPESMNTLDLDHLLSTLFSQIKNNLEKIITNADSPMAIDKNIEKYLFHSPNSSLFTMGIENTPLMSGMQLYGANTPPQYWRSNPVPNSPLSVSSFQGVSNPMFSPHSVPTHLETYPLPIDGFARPQDPHTNLDFSAAASNYTKNPKRLFSNAPLSKSGAGSTASGNEIGRSNSQITYYLQELPYGGYTGSLQPIAIQEKKEDPKMNYSFPENPSNKSN